jgi:hypothetical protein
MHDLRIIKYELKHLVSQRIINKGRTHGQGMVAWLLGM